MIDLIDRYKKWRLTNAAESDSESDSDVDQAGNGEESDWNLTVKGPPSHKGGDSKIEGGSEANLSLLSYIDHNKNDQGLGQPLNQNSSSGGGGRSSYYVGHSSSLDISNRSEQTAVSYIEK